MKAFIINYNRLTLMANMADWLAKRGCQVIIIDNGSDYPPLLDWYRKTEHHVHFMGVNYGHRVIWERGILDLFEVTGRHIITDSDLDLSGVPDDFIEVLSRGLDLHPNAAKCGLSLEIEDLPESSEGNFIRYHCEARYWLNKLPTGYWNAPVDTTFAMYRETARSYTHSGVRSDRPYTAKHVPWYYVNYNRIPEDEKYYFKTASEQSSSGKLRILKNLSQ